MVINIIRQCLLFFFSVPLLFLTLCFSKRFVYVLSFVMGFSSLTMGLVVIALMDDLHIAFKLFLLAFGAGLLTLMLWTFKEQVKIFVAELGWFNR